MIGAEESVMLGLSNGLMPQGIEFRKFCTMQVDIHPGASVRYVGQFSPGQRKNYLGIIAISGLLL
jgi:hypothetical protein